MKAPRVLREVEGDFTAQVKVTGDFKPGEQSASPETSSFNAAGLLLWQDSKNYIRLERNAWRTGDGQYACYPPLFEHYRDGQYQNTNPDGTTDDFFKGRSTWLKLERRAGKVIASYSHDGKEWTEVKQIDVELPRKVQIGVAAVNTSTKPLTVEFEGLSVRPQ
jgi:regulation of enolase protein 1 (concanavalin A-like superfamily)